MTLKASASLLSLAGLLLAATAGATPIKTVVPACPASLGGYTATVQGNDVIVCPTTAPVPGEGSAVCPFTLGLARIDTVTGAAATIYGPCVANPQSGAGGEGDAGTPCYIDSCVAPGTYEYGYELPPFAFCANEACAGPTSGEWAVVATVTGAPVGCTSLAAPSSPPFWVSLDAGIVDGTVPWSGTCTGPLPDPVGGQCAWEFLDGAAQWAPCPADGGALCAGTEGDGAVIPVPCSIFGNVDAGASGGGSDTGATNGGHCTSGTEEGCGGAAASSSGGCSMASGSTPASLNSLVALALAFAMRARRKRARA